MIDAEKLVQEVENEKNWHGDVPGSPEQQVDYWREMEDPGAHSYNDAASVSTISSPLSAQYSASTKKYF